MGRIVILAEKPSVAKNIADALAIKTKRDGYFEGSHYLITWAFGHLVQLYDARDYDSKMARWQMSNFPFIPETFQYKVKGSPKDRKQPDQGAVKQLKLIHSLIRRSDVESIVSACDYDREGQLIGDSIIYRANPTKPVYRLLLNEWTRDEVLRGLDNLKPNQTLRPLQDAGVSRQWADWLIGINLTSVATLKYQKGRGKVLNIGRVLLPTLKIIYDRDKEIETFQPEEYFKLTSTFLTKNGQTYDGTYVKNKNEKFKDREQLIEIQQQIQDQPGTITDKQVETKKEFAPLLFNLSNLQGYITNKFKGWTSDKVLKVAQSLYEKKYITYPRTSSVALDESLVGKTAKELEIMKEDSPFKDEIIFRKLKRVFNNAKVESHSAITPTYVKPKQLSSDEQVVYTAIKNRFIVQFMPVAEYEETKLATKIETIDGYFASKGKVQLVEGWKKVENIQTKENLLPYVDVEDKVDLHDVKVTVHTTKPPKPHTEKSLLRVMETAGKNYQEEDLDQILTGFSIGTPATRAETIKRLKNVDYITSKGKNLLCTELGRKLVETFPAKELFDLEFTGRLEKTLADIQKGTVKKQAFLDVIYSFTKDSVATIQADQEIVIRESSPVANTREVLGTCPACGGKIMEGRKGFGCSNWKDGCGFVIWKNDKYLQTMKKKATKTMVKQLLKNKRIYVKGLTSKKGKKFSAYLQYTKNPDNKYYSWKMDFGK